MVLELLSYCAEFIGPFLGISLYVFIKPKSLLSLLVNLLLASSFFIVCYYHLSWYCSSIYLRYFFATLFLWATISNLRTITKQKWINNTKTPFFLLLGFKLAILAFLGYELFWVGKGLYEPNDSIQLSFPLKNGKFVVTSGGSSNMVNEHFNSKMYWYAVDLAKLNSIGKMWNNDFLLSKRLNDYPIFGDTLYSPCQGIVLETNKMEPDNPIGIKADKSNFIRLKYSDRYEIMMAHLKHNSIFVDSGDFIVAGQPLALIGNSGRSSEPHLHIHAQHSRFDIYVPIEFDGNYPIKNKIINN